MICLELGCSEGCPEVTWQPLPLNLQPCSGIGVGGTRPFSNIMAPLALFNEGVPAHFFHLMEVPTMRLPNVKNVALLAL